MTSVEGQASARRPAETTPAPRADRVRASQARKPGRSLLRRLRGREPWLLLAAVVGALIGGGLGWLSGRSLFRATAVIQVHNPLAKPAPGIAELVTEHLAAQRDLLASVRSQLHPTDPVYDQRLMDVEPAEGVREALEVSLLAAEPDTARAALQKLLDVYAAQHTRFREGVEAELSALQARRDALEARLADLDRRVTEEARAFGPVPLDQVAAARMATLRETQDLLAQTDVALAAAVDDAGSDDPRAALEQLARADETLRSLLQTADAAAERLASLRRTMGPNAPAVREAADAEQQARTRIDDHLRASRAQRVAAQGMGVAASADGEAPVLLATRDELQARRAALVSLRDTVSAELQDVQRRAAATRTLTEEAETVRAELTELQPQLDRLALERQVAAAVHVGRPAAAPQPYVDSRPSRAILGASLGILAGLALTPLVLLADNRVRRAEAAQLDDPNAPLFGAVPALDESGLSGEAGDAAALSIHEIRALMQIRAETHGARAFAITSPTRGAGKTSLTVGLASSLALSGTRTLLVDCDLAQRHAPATPVAAKKPGDPAPAASPGSTNATRPVEQKQNLDQVMLQMGYLDDTDPEVFLLSHDQSVGMTGLLEGQPLTHCVIETSVPGLSILPALSASSQHIARMSTAFVRRLIDDARQDYDMIIFDTGPVPGSVEALVVTSEADAVILVVSRGEFRDRFEKAVAYLRVVGAPLIGTVFNRARNDDLTVEAPIDAGRKRPAAPLRPAQRIAGSGLLAAAVHVQSHQEIHPANRPKTRAETEQRRRAPGVTEPETPQIAEPAAPAAPAPTPRRRAGEPRNGEPQITLADVGDFTQILQESKPRRASAQRPAPAADAATTPAAPPKKPEGDLEQALDELVSNARTPAPVPRRTPAAARGAEPDAS